MKKIALFVAFVMIFFTINGQTKKEMNKRIVEIEDRIALKNLVDTFSILADQKETQKQTFLFTENAVVESISQGRQGSKLTGRKEIGDAFAAYLSNFEIVYHINGQQTVSIEGDIATGISYCQVTLIGMTGGKRIRTTMGVWYYDEFIRENKQWLIAKRTSNFAWTDRQEIGQ
jgi:hypothetical protein